MSNDVTIANAVSALVLWGFAEVAWMLTTQVWFHKHKAQPFFAESDLIVANGSASQCELDENESSSTTEDVANHLHL